MITRREALQNGAALGGWSILGSLGLSSAALAQESAPAATQPADAGEASSEMMMVEYALPPLPYPYEALEPYINGRTMHIHHLKHHAAYTKNLNNTLVQLQLARDRQDWNNVQALSRALSFNAGGYVNHIIFFCNMCAAPKSGSLSGELMKQLQQDYGSFEKFKDHFTAAALKVEGNGWAVLAWQPLLMRTTITQMQSQMDLNLVGAIPLLMLDVWEHAYYLDYQNQRDKYIEAWWNVVNWKDISERLGDAKNVRIPVRN
ncbi:MAG: hypothetical protein HJJLKODD_02730 [Phycisphaerae bacterium]|nr:hypothetical protein [Phycisphaerae bacterium]